MVNPISGTNGAAVASLENTNAAPGSNMDKEEACTSVGTFYPVTAADVLAQDHEVDSIQQALNTSIDEDAKIQALSTFLNKKLISCAQIGRILGCTTSVNTKMVFMSLLSVRCSDPTECLSQPGQIINSFRFTSERQKVTEMFKARERVMKASDSTVGDRRTSDTNSGRKGRHELFARPVSLGRTGRGGKGAGRSVGRSTPQATTSQPPPPPTPPPTTSQPPPPPTPPPTTSQPPPPPTPPPTTSQPPPPPTPPPTTSQPPPPPPPPSRFTFAKNSKVSAAGRGRGGKGKNQTQEKNGAGLRNSCDSTANTNLDDAAAHELGINPPMTGDETEAKSPPISTNLRKSVTMVDDNQSPETFSNPPSDPAVPPDMEAEEVQPSRSRALTIKEEADPLDMFSTAAIYSAAEGVGSGLVTQVGGVLTGMGTLGMGAVETAVETEKVVESTFGKMLGW